MFCDLNVPCPTNQSQETFFEETIQRLIEFGYKTVAVTRSLDETIFKKKEKKKKSKGQEVDDDDKKDIVQLPYNITQLKTKYQNKLKILSRVNLIISENIQLQKVFQSKNIKKYDIISVEPTNVDVLRFISSYPGINIISYNPESKNILYMQRKLYNQICSQGMYFEIVYSPAILDSSCRRHLIMLGHRYHTIGKCRNVIVSSTAQIALHVRRPYDVMNLNLIFGLSEEQARAAISYNCLKAIQEANKLHRGKSIVSMSVIQSPGKNSLKQSTEDVEMQV